MTPEERQAVRERCERASPAPWPMPDECVATETNSVFYDNRRPLDHEGCDIWPWHREEDMEFAYRARTDLPALLAEVERLEGVLATPPWYEHEVERLKMERDTLQLQVDTLKDGGCVHDAGDGVLLMRRNAFDALQAERDALREAAHELAEFVATLFSKDAEGLEVETAAVLVTRVRALLATSERAEKGEGR